MRWYREAWGLLRRDRELRKLALKPMWLSILAFLLVLFAVGSLLANLIVGLFTTYNIDLGPVPMILAVVATLALSGILFFAVASVVGSAFWDRLTRETEARVGVEAPPDPGFSVQFGDTVKRLFFSLTMALLSLCTGFLVPVVGPVIVAGYTATVDATGGSFLRRGIGLGGQMFRVVRLPGAFGFLVLAGVLSLVPLLNVFALPLTMTAGALMAANGLSTKALDKPPRNLDTI